MGMNSPWLPDQQPTVEEPPPPTDVVQFASERMAALRDAESTFPDGYDRPVSALSEEGSPLHEFLMLGEAPMGTREERAAWGAERLRLEGAARAAVDEAMEVHALQAERKRFAEARAATDWLEARGREAEAANPKQGWAGFLPPPPVTPPKGDKPSAPRYGRWNRSHE